MTLMQAPPDEAVSAAVAHHDSAAGLEGLARWVDAHPHAIIPATWTVTLPVPPGTWEQKRAWLTAVAASWDTAVLEPRGFAITEKRFGPVRLVAVLRAPDYTKVIAGRDPLALPPRTEAERIIADAGTGPVAA